MTAKPWKLLERCVEDGIAYGVRRAFKHSDDAPGEETYARITNAVQSAIMNEVSEWFSFPEDPE